MDRRGSKMLPSAEEDEVLDLDDELKRPENVAAIAAAKDVLTARSDKIEVSAQMSKRAISSSNSDSALLLPRGKSILHICSDVQVHNQRSNVSLSLPSRRCFIAESW